jgi:predicted peroxiredoxin
LNTACSADPDLNIKKYDEMLSGYEDKYRKTFLFRFFLNIFWVIAIVICMDFLIGSLLRFFYFKQQSGFQYRTTYSIEKTKADLLIFGSSRANHHYQPEVFEKKMNLSFYNVGRDGVSIFYDYAILQAILARYFPKIVILDFERKEFERNQENYDRISFLLPYYKTHPEIHSIVKLKGPYEQIKLLSQIYPFNSSIFTIANGNIKMGGQRYREIKGYVPLTKEWVESLKAENIASSSNQLDSNKIKLYESFIKECIKSRVKLYIVCSPYFVKSGINDSSIMKGREIARKYNINFFDYSLDTLFSGNRSLYADVQHLSDDGAKKFSDLITDKILESDRR